MRIKLFLVLLLLPVVAAAQGFDNSSLSGKYFFVHLLVSVGGDGQATNARNLGGSMTFDGVGGYTFQGRLGSGSGAPEAFEGAGAYSVQSSSFTTLTNPIENNLEINARVGAESEVVLGASTEAGEATYDLFVAVKAPENGISNATLNGAYTGSSLLLPNGSDSGISTAIAFLTADGAGSFSPARTIGHSAAEQDVNVDENITNATYALNGDGTGTASFGSSSTVISGNRDVFVSANGNYLIGFSTEPGGREIFLAVKNFSNSANNSSWNGGFWVAEVLIDLDINDQGLINSYTSATGGIRANGDGTAPIAERQLFDALPLDFGAIQFYRVDQNSTGDLAAFLDPLITNFAIGAPENGQPQAFAGAQVLAENDPSVRHGIFFGIRTPEITGDGVFLSPLGVVNAASFAPPTFPISGGALISLFGSGLSPSTEQAGAIPLPTSLQGVSVTINNVPAPLLFVSAGQINLQVPFSTAGTSAAIVVNNNGDMSNEVTVPVAETSPGIFSVEETGFGPGTVVHSDFSLVNEANPAAPGETVVIFLTGLGPLDPPIADGAAGPSTEPLSRTTDPGLQVLFGGEAGDVFFSGAAPGFVGLYQINATIPNPVLTGAAIPVAIFTSNAFSCFTDIAIGF